MKDEGTQRHLREAKMANTHQASASQRRDANKMSYTPERAISPSIFDSANDLYSDARDAILGRIFHEELVYRDTP